MAKIKLESLKLNAKNPRKITRRKLDELKNNIQGFEKMMRINGLVIDENNTIQAGNHRYKALLELGYTEIPKEWVRKFEDFTEDEWADYVVLDNQHFASWDDEILLENYEFAKLKEFGLDVQPKKEVVEPEMEFSEELMLEHNYVVLYFDNPMDWQVAIDKLGLKEVKSAIKTIKSQKVGIGRVIKGAEIINRIP